MLSRRITLVAMKELPILSNPKVRVYKYEKEMRSYVFPPSYLSLNRRRLSLLVFSASVISRLSLECSVRARTSFAARERMRVWLCNATLIRGGNDLVTGARSYTDV